MKKFLALLSIAIIQLSVFTSFAYAKSYDIVITDGVNVKYNGESDFVTVKETYNLVVNNNSYYYQSGIALTFYLTDFDLQPKASERKFKKDSLKILDGEGIAPQNSVKEIKDGLQVTVKTSRKINLSNPYTLTLEYNTHELINKNGNIVNIYVPGIAKNTKFEEKESRFGISIKYDYPATVTVPSNTPEPAYLEPNDMQKSTQGQNTVYTISQTERLGKLAWLQLGTAQYYYFKIEQKTPKTDNLTPTQISNVTPIVSTNIYKLALPRELDETNQQIFIKEMNPQPKKIERDNEGNLVGIFEMPANKEGVITVEGYIQQSKKLQTDPTNMPISTYLEEVKNIPNYTSYISAGKYWEVNDPEIIKIANDIKDSVKSDNIMDLIQADYKYIVDKFSYSYEKLKNGNQRIGAKAALDGGQATCMEYSDALTAILRAQKIPSRIALGYGNDPTGAENAISNTQLLEQKVGHQWTQIWIPERGWMSIDPTWGESGRTYIGSDLDHILIYTIATDAENVADVKLYTADIYEKIDLTGYKFALQALNEGSYKDISGIKPIDELVNNYKNTEVTGLLFTLQTSILGRVIIYLLPAFVAFGIFPILLTALINAIKKLNKSKDVSLN